MKVPYEVCLVGKPPGHATSPAAYTHVEPTNGVWGLAAQTLPALHPPARNPLPSHTLRPVLHAADDVVGPPPEGVHEPPLGVESAIVISLLLMAWQAPVTVTRAGLLEQVSLMRSGAYSDMIGKLQLTPDGASQSHAEQVAAAQLRPLLPEYVEFG